MPVPDDQLLLAQVATGDEEALRQLYLGYRPRLRRYLWHQLDGDATSVDEALQDVFLAVWRSAGDYRAEARVSTWLYRIAHNVAVGARRRRARQAGFVRLDASDECDDALGSSAASYIMNDSGVLDRLALGDALSRLSAKHRDVLVLIFLHGFSMQEVAQVLDVPT